MATTQLGKNHSTTGTVYIADGTSDGQTGWYNHTDGSTNVIRKAIPITVENVRNLPQQPKSNLEGYQLVTFPTHLPEEPFLNANLPENKHLIESAYFSECRRLVLEVTGAAEAYPYVYRVRNQERHVSDFHNSDFHRDSVPVVHVDRDAETAPERLRASLGAAEAERLLRQYRHYGSMNVWRPVRNVVQRWPLMLVDHRGIPDWDYDTHMLRLQSNNDGRVSTRGSKDHENILRFDERYRYVYADEMRPDEAWLFYAFHSDPALGVPHGAFWDDSTKPDALTRWSVEVRVWVFFGEL